MKPEISKMSTKLILSYLWSCAEEKPVSEFSDSQRLLMTINIVTGIRETTLKSFRLLNCTNMNTEKMYC